MQGGGAVMTYPNGHAVVIEHLTHVVGVHTVHHERHR